MIQGNGGIGFELASQLLSDLSKHVLLGSRSAEKGEAAVKDLQSRKQPGTVELLTLDVASEESITSAAKTVESKYGRYAQLDLAILGDPRPFSTSYMTWLTNPTRLDALVNNAAIAMPPGTLAQQMTQCFHTNVIGPALMLESFGPLLKKANGTPRVINVSSGQGSIARRLDATASGHNIKGLQYRTTKAALNMLTACQVAEYGESGFKVFAFCPGFTVSNLSPRNNAESGAKPTSEGAAPMVNILNGERDAEHARFLHGAGHYPW